MNITTVEQLQALLQVLRDHDVSFLELDGLKLRLFPAQSAYPAIVASQPGTLPDHPGAYPSVDDQGDDPLHELVLQGLARQKTLAAEHKAGA